MPYQPVEIAPVSTFYGEPQTLNNSTQTINGREVRVAPSYDSTTPYKGPPERNPKKCVGADYTCNGWKAKGTDFCVGHLRSRGEL